jgi:hypothetical protein
MKIKDSNTILLCCTYKNKNEHIQCPNKRKDNLKFCGKHKNMKDIIFNDNQIDVNVNVNNDNKNEDVNKDIKENSPVEIEVNNYTQNTINNILNDGKIADIDTDTDTKTDTTDNNKLSLSNSRKKTIKSLEKNKYYDDYLNIRKTYIKNNTKHIELIDYIENSNLETYSLSRINASLDYYKLLKIKHTENSQFLQAIYNIANLNIFFDILLKANKFLPQVIKLQRYIKKSLLLLKKNTHGPALSNRQLCVNDSDFFTLDELKDIPNDDFFSFSDEKKFIYGFNIDSIIQLILKSDENYFEQFSRKIKNRHTTNTTPKICYYQFIKILYNHYSKIKIINPYTRFIIDNKIKLKAIRLYARKEYDINRIEDIVEVVDIKTLVKNKCLTIFQKIDMFGYQTDINWLYDQSQTVLKIFYKKLALLWNFEFGLNNEARYKIAHSHNIFVNLHDIMISKQDKYTLLDKILEPVNAMVSNGQTDADKQSGCIIVLYALAFINNRCVMANPWLA